MVTAAHLSVLALCLLSCVQRERGEIVLGAFSALSGPRSAAGLALHRGIEVAVDSLNEAGGVLGRKLRLVPVDDGGDPRRTRLAVSRLIDSSRVVALIGGLDSADGMAAAEICQARRIPLVVPAATQPGITQSGEFVFRTALPDPQQAHIMAHFGRRVLNLQSLYILREVGNGYSNALADAIRDVFFHADGDVLGDLGYRGGDTDFTALLTTIAARDPEGIFLPGRPEDARRIVSQARRLGLRSVFLGGQSWDSPDLLAGGDPDLDNSFYPVPYSSESPFSDQAAFARRYRARFGSADNMREAMAALGYDAAMVLADALRRAGSVQPDRIRAALAVTRQFPGATGRITLDLNRDAVKPAVVMEVHADGPGSGRVSYRETIAP